MIELVAFLGNPEHEYGGTRHNAGRMLAQKLPFYQELSWQKKYRGLYAALDYAALARTLPQAHPPENTLPPDAPASRLAASRLAASRLTARLHFVIPETYMNNSGESVQAAAAFFKIPPEHILAVHDELEMPLGVAGFKFGGGLGGHNGLRSLKASLGTADFWRFRIGIGRPGDREPGKGGPQGVHGDIFGWVLSPFTKEEIPLLDGTLSGAAQAVAESLAAGAETMLPAWSKKRVFPAAE